VNQCESMYVHVALCYTIDDWIRLITVAAHVNGFFVWK